jgi:hypothetical protein
VTHLNRVSGSLAASPRGNPSRRSGPRLEGRTVGPEAKGHRHERAQDAPRTKKRRAIAVSGAGRTTGFRRGAFLVGRVGGGLTAADRNRADLVAVPRAAFGRTDQAPRDSGPTVEGPPQAGLSAAGPEGSNRAGDHPVASGRASANPADKVAVVDQADDRHPDRAGARRPIDDPEVVGPAAAGQAAGAAGEAADSDCPHRPFRAAA